MILSALLTSVGINLGLCFLFFTFYSILRKQPGNLRVYAPRLVAERRVKRKNDFNFERLLPSAGWVKRAWEQSEEELLENSGLDGVVFMRVFTFSLKVFAIAAIIGVFILLPINFMGNQLVIDISDLPNKSLDSFSISNVNNGSNRLWVHFCAAYVFTGAVCYLLYYEYKMISLKRIACFYASQPKAHLFTVLVRGIPVTAGSSFSDSIDQFFKEYHPLTYLSHTVVRRTSKLQQLTNDAEKMYGTVAQIKSEEHTSQRSIYNGFFGLFGNRHRHMRTLEKRLEDMEDSMRLEQSSLPEKEVPAAFVSFKSQYGAAIALHIQQGVNPTEWVIEQAPEPDDVYWPFFSTSFFRRWICKLVVLVASAVLIVLFLGTVVIVQGLTHLEQLEKYFPFLKSILTIAFVSQVITGYLPSLILQSFLYFIPPIMKMLSSIQGYISMSGIQKSACGKMLWFTIWNIFFANVLSGTALSQVKLIFEPKKIPEILAEGVPAQASFFISYVVTSGWTSLSSELFQLFNLICSHLRRLFAKETEDLTTSPIPYESEIPRILFFVLLGITYFFLAPLILPFILVYFCMGYLIFRNQLLNVYAPKYETGGNYWPIVHNSTILSLVLMHIIAFGIFGLKVLPLASTLIIPLPILTLLFNEYCRKRFLPLFKAFPAECLIKKDREEHNDPRMGEFLEKLMSAYEDPVLKPTQYSRNADSQTSPLLQSREI
ncbi:CSC1-like protein HYP1 isoform X1 [Beta vulgaris subsp. vulgaris]|uniref:CSC1-like protein HYP1 isoform X1 n=1 Tax=Beta vulgaris subsp. vulgaris TaxID=3555 RepID=UPI002036FA12|nr:CSC1-like protein HYP1 isoform X1 [Beta vulgaris subsp. vulgaris]